jgi:glycosyltransferase involved in cell wall biosynthesis
MKIMPRLVVVPTDPLSAYESKGIGSRLRDYYNPLGMFDEVVCLSPFEWERREAFGMKIEPCSAANFKSKLHDIAPSVIRAYGGGLACDMATSAADSGIPIIVSVHDLHPELMRASLKRADRVLAVSDAVGRALLAMGISSDRISFLSNRIDIDRFSPPQPGSRLDDTENFEILHLGRKTPAKNLDVLIRAMPHLSGNYTLTAAGPGDPTPYQELAAAIGVADRVRLTGSIPNPELPDRLRRAACLCNASRWEGFGMVLIEALACGTPGVARNCAPATEFMIDGISGVLVDKIDEPAHIADAIKRACENRDLRARLRSVGPMVAKRFSLTLQSRAEARIYQEIIR